MADVVLLASGYDISQALDKDTPASAGVPTAAPIAAAPVPSGEEPTAAVAKAPEHARSVAGVIDRLGCLRLRLPATIVPELADFQGRMTARGGPVADTDQHLIRLRPPAGQSRGVGKHQLSSTGRRRPP